MNPKAFLIIGNFVKFGCITISGMILSRFYSKSELGTYLQGVLLIATISEIAAWGLPKAVLFYGGIEKNKKNLILHVLILISSTASTFGLLFWLLRDKICGLFSNPNLHMLALILALNLIARAFNIVLGTIMMIVNKVNFMSLIYVISSIINVTAFATLAYLKAPVLHLFICSFGLEVAQIFFFLLVLALTKNEDRFEWNPRLISNILTYSSPLMLNILIIMAGRKLDSFLVSGFFNPEDYAVYSRGALELPFSQMILVSIASLLMPQISRLFHEKKPVELTRLLSNEIHKISLLIFPMFFGLLLVYRDLITFLYSEKYASSSSVFLVYLLLVPIQLYSFDSILQAFNKTIWVNVASIAYVLTNLGIGLSLIHFMGVLGPAIGVLCGTLINSSVNLYLINRFLGNSFRNWLPWAKLAKVLLISSSPLVLLWPLSLALPHKAVIRLFIGSGFYYPIVIILLWRFNEIPAVYREKVQRLLRSGKRKTYP